MESRSVSEAEYSSSASSNASASVGSSPARSDSDYDLLSHSDCSELQESEVQTDDQLRELALSTYADANQQLQQGNYAQGMMTLERAADLFKKISNKNSDEWQLLSAIQEKRAHLYQTQHQVLLDTVLRKVQAYGEEVKTMKRQQEEMNECAAASYSQCLEMLGQNDYRLLMATRSVNDLEDTVVILNNRIHQLENQPRQTVMELISQEVRQKFSTSSIVAFSRSLFNSIYSFFHRTPRPRASTPDLESQSINFPRYPL